MTEPGAASVALPDIGETVCLRWAGRWVHAVVVEHKGGSMLDLDHNGITLLSVGYDLGGWQWTAPKGQHVEQAPGEQHV